MDWNVSFPLVPAKISISLQLLVTPSIRGAIAHPNFVGSICANSSSTESPQKTNPQRDCHGKGKQAQMALRKMVEGDLSQ